MGQAKALHALGEVYLHQSKHTEAASSYTRAGGIYHFRFKYAEANSFHRKAIDVYARIGDSVGEAKASYGLGEVYSPSTEAEPYYRLAQDIYDRIGDAGGQAKALYALGEVYLRRVQYIQATSSYTRAGEIYGSRCRYMEAESSYKQARYIYSRIGDGGGQAKASYDLGAVYHSQSEYTEATSSVCAPTFLALGLKHGLRKCLLR